MSNRRSYSDEQRELIALGMSKGWPLTAIEGSPEFQAATRAQEKLITKERENFTAEHYLAHGNDGPFKDARERERAFSHPLYSQSEEYRKAVAHKASQTSNAIMGVVEPPQPLTPTALLRAAQIDSYHTIKADLFTKASENNPNKVEAAQARVRILELGQDPAYVALMNEVEPDPHPYQTWLAAQPGGVQVQTFPTHLSPEEQQQEANRRNEAAYIAKPGGLGDGGVSGPANTTLR